MENAISGYLGRLDALAKKEACAHAQAIFLGLLEPIAAEACVDAPEFCVQIQELAGIVAEAAAADFRRRECS